MGGAKLTMKNPGSPIQRMFGPDPSTKTTSAPMDSPEDEMGESYDVTDDELATLQAEGTVQLASGCTLNKVESAPDAAASGAPPSTPPSTPPPPTM